MTHYKSSSCRALFGGGVLLAFGALPAAADFVINDDLIVDGSACIGFDCVNGESFSFDTIRLKENNLRIKFEDTSTAQNFPSTDWQLTANASANGGANKFSIDDISAGRTPFTVEANAPSHALYVDDGGRLGLGTSTPSTEIHAIDGDTPTLRLQQDGSSGFAPQTWDVAGNETNFFVRDVSNGSTLPFRIRPGAPTSSIFIEADGNVGLQTASPDANLHVVGDGFLVEQADTAVAPTGLAEIRGGDLNVTEGGSFNVTGGGNISVTNAGPSNFTLDDTTDAGPAFRVQVTDSTTRMSYVGTGVIELELDTNGNLDAAGTVTATGFIAGGQALNVPDYVFADDYDLMPLTEVAAFIDANSHLPKIPSAAEINANGLNQTEMQLSLLEKVEELTLYTLAQHRDLEQLQVVNRQQQDQIAVLTQQLEQLVTR